MLKRISLRLFSKAEVEDLHLFLCQLLIIVLNDQINECICHEHVIKVFEITLEFIIERTISKAIENLFAFFNRLVTQYDLFDFIIGLNKNINI